MRTSALPLMLALAMLEQLAHVCAPISIDGISRGVPGSAGTSGQSHALVVVNAIFKGPARTASSRFLVLATPPHPGSVGFECSASAPCGAGLQFRSPWSALEC